MNKLHSILLKIDINVARENVLRECTCIWIKLLEVEQNFWEAL
jgi:hypothetical protein